MHRLLLAVAALWLFAAASYAQSPSPGRPSALNTARRNGWQLVLLVNKALQASRDERFPGIAAWQAELRRRYDDNLRTDAITEISLGVRP